MLDVPRPRIQKGLFPSSLPPFPVVSPAAVMCTWGKLRPRRTTRRRTNETIKNTQKTQSAIHIDVTKTLQTTTAADTCFPSPASQMFFHTRTHMCAEFLLRGAGPISPRAIARGRECWHGKCPLSRRLARRITYRVCGRNTARPLVFPLAQQPPPKNYIAGVPTTEINPRGRRNISTTCTVSPLANPLTPKPPYMRQNILATGQNSSRRKKRANSAIAPPTPYPLQHLFGLCPAKNNDFSPWMARGPSGQKQDVRHDTSIIQARSRAEK